MKRILSLAGLGLATFLAAGVSAADGHITHIEEVGAPDRPLIVAGSDRGVVFIGADHELFRAFHHRQTALSGSNQPFLWVEDIDGDGHKEVVGAGRPSFVIDHNGDPIWGILDGCDRYFLGDFIEDSNLELLCIRGTSVSVWSYDGQEYFSWTGRGYSIASCEADDYDSDQKLEVACSLTNGNHLYFDIEEWFSNSNYDPVRSGPAPEAMGTSGVDRSAMERIVSGEEPLRVGRRQVTIGFEAGAIQLVTDGVTHSVPVSSRAIYSAAAADLDRDSIFEIYVGGDDEVYILRADGTLLATIAANPDRATRDARVRVRGASANGLQDSERESIVAVVEGNLNAIQSCYSRRMGTDQFTRVGTMLWELAINSSGRVTGTTKRHSGLRNTALEGCVSDALKTLRFSGATGSSGVVSVTLEFDFVDRIN